MKTKMKLEMGMNPDKINVDVKGSGFKSVCVK
jgi:hypothetical protein